MTKRKLLKLLTAGTVIFSAALFAVSFAIPSGIYYIYEYGEIATHSERDAFACFCAVVFLAEGVLFIGLTAAETVFCIKERQGIFSTVINAGVKILSGFFCGGMLIFAMLPALTAYDYRYPEWYTFTDGCHTVVIEETSFLLDGRGKVYQVLENNEAVPIASFTTDDGITNSGNYRMEWTEEYVDITYHTFTDNDRIETVRAKFIQ